MKLFSSEIAINNHLYSFDHNKRDSLLLISLEAVDNTYKRSSEHLTVSVTLAWLNNCGNEDGGSCLAQRRGLDPVICLFPQIPVPHPINSVSPFTANSVSPFSADSGHASLSFMEARDMKKGELMELTT
ncbi:hypothetical protein IGI04_030122 [Brassica rapa subsp. trilocularis]|uniref:Uncharacterized protein n=1 Tax=Brassica rapa subsp. trilocularis TaxID=1813537 RepID=A0ABQ7LTR8_BRACM|nr:hypothetical protein IGI04_030122 [Brassica rapa subsp. trilocularis]